VLLCTVLVYATVTEFLFGIIDRVNPTLLNCIIICSNMGLGYCSLIGVKILICHQKKDVLLLEYGSSTSDFCVLCPCEETAKIIDI
jgi:hypothetical protein